MPRAPLVGRDRELSVLMDALESVRAGQGRTVLVVGPDGAGSSALLRGLREELGQRALPNRWVATRGLPDDAAYAALAGLLPAGPRDTPGGLEALLDGITLVPVDSRPAVVGERLARALDPSGGVALVLVVERADLLDPRAAAALATAVRALRRTPTLVVATATSATGWPADQVLPLDALHPADAALLAARLAPDDPARARALIELARGLPGVMVAWSRWPDLRVPATEQLLGVAPHAGELCLAAGLAQGHLGDPELAAAVGADPQSLAALSARGVLRRATLTAEPTSGGWTAPQAWLEVARGATPPGVRRRVCAALAHALAAAEAPARLIAEAADAAGDRKAARAWWVQAADRAGADADTRATYLLRALGTDPTLGADPTLGTDPTREPPRDDGPDGLGPSDDLSAAVPLVLSAADALLAVGRSQQAADLLAGATARAPRHDRAPLARLLVRRYRALLLRGQPDEAARSLAEAGGLLQGAPDGAPPERDLPAARAEVWTAQSMATVLSDPGAASALAEAARAAADATSDPTLQAAARGALALAIGLSGDVPRAVETFDEALRLAEQGTDRALEARLAANRIYVLWRGGELTAMETALTAELARLERTGLARAAGGQLLVGRAVVLHALGRWAELGQHLAATLSEGPALGAQVELLLRLTSVELAGDQGRAGEARAALAAIRERTAADEEIAYEVMAVRLGLATLAGDLTEAPARGLVDEAFSLADQLEADPFAAARVRVAALRLLGWATDRAGGPLPEVPSPEPSLHRAAVRPGETETEGSSQPAELSALLAEESAWRSGAGWDRAVQSWTALPMPYRAAWARLCQAQVAARSGDPAQALSLVGSARATADALGAAPLRSAAERLARQLGQRGSRLAGELTARERDVVAQVALGRTNREIARALGMSERTVAVHLTRIFAKLGAGTRGEVTHLARQRGLIDS